MIQLNFAVYITSFLAQWNVFLRCSFDVKTSADKMICKFLTFSCMNSVFFQTNWVYRPKKVNWVKKKLNLCKKLSKICKIILSADVFTAKQNLRKHSTVSWLGKKQYLLITQPESSQICKLKPTISRGN